MAITERINFALLIFLCRAIIINIPATAVKTGKIYAAIPNIPLENRTRHALLRQIVL